MGSVQQVLRWRRDDGNKDREGLPSLRRGALLWDYYEDLQVQHCRLSHIRKLQDFDPIGTCFNLSDLTITLVIYRSLSNESAVSVTSMESARGSRVTQRPRARSSASGPTCAPCSGTSQSPARRTRASSVAPPSSPLTSF